MTTSKRVTTDDHQPKRFRPHGLVEYVVLDNILVCEAIGPFNLELIGSAVSVESPLIDTLVKQGKWGDVVVFKQSAMASLEVLSSLTGYLRSLSTSMKMPSATALVISPKIEGSRIMTPHYRKCYADAGVEVAVFDDVDAALVWMQNRLGSSPAR
ncbi:hypothetical protein [Aeromonas taiwanensis]|uniref:hypothetical protein n=1 Tax=Aeromonas taiwanensis TaxID=633417 RepID=UPI00207C97B4|nr:hypothetical protein [Aeromonas taiwanensis]MCO4205074.1 hypothetical protein [Aeromonas taiwanensis]